MRNWLGNELILGSITQATLVYLLRKVVCWFCFLITLRSFKPKCLLLCSLVLLKSPQSIRVNPCDLIMFRPMLQELLNIEQFFIENSIKLEARLGPFKIEQSQPKSVILKCQDILQRSIKMKLRKVCKKFQSLGLYTTKP
jgi:hypothetical protein